MHVYRVGGTLVQKTNDSDVTLSVRF